MSWRKRDDLGTNLIAKIHETARLQDEWLVDCGRGFTYWPSDFATTITCDAPIFHNAYSVFRVHAETEIARGKGQHPEAVPALARRMSGAALSALIYDEKADLYKLQCSVYAHCDNEEWLTRVFLGAVGLQVGRAMQWAKWMQDELGLEGAQSRHPVKGRRTPYDPIVGAVDQFAIPYGRQPNRWAQSPEWEDAYRVIRRMARACTIEDGLAIKADFEWLEDQPIQLEITTTTPHPELGNGLLMTLKVPWSVESDDCGRTAMALNDMERADWNWCHDLGAWSTTDDRLMFQCFVPNICFAPGSLADLAHDMAIRARWVNDTAGLSVLGVET